ncbi:MAG: response regulator transcription factor [Actinomycetota bacterium]|nr:response regulator transcription factor [Actinomycetota bacterium]
MNRAHVVRVVIADDHTVLREGLRRSLESAGLAVVGEAADGAEAVTVSARVRPDVVLMDVSLPVQDGIEATRQLRVRAPGVSVVMLTMFADGTTLQEALSAGAVGYLVKDCTTAEIVETLRSVASGETVLSPGLAQSFLAAASHEASPAHVLTRREVEVLELLARGSSTAQVAAEMFISAKTVKNHLAHIYDKLDAQDRTQAVLQAVRLGIVRLD